MTARRPRVQCECADSGCPVHLGADYCHETTYPKNRLYRIDQDDISGTIFCALCLVDALESGVFTSERGER